MKLFICQVCGHLSFNEAPAACPVCAAPKEKYTQKDNVFIESRAKSPEAEIKHIPVLIVNKTCGLLPDDGCTDVLIKIGAKTHPMETKHYIMFADCYLDNKYVERVMFTPDGVYPAAVVHLKKDITAKAFTAVINCNVHGYWYKDIAL
jgi:desulfoferrodoxin-like iron-binding protein